MLCLLKFPHEAFEVAFGQIRDRDPERGESLLCVRRGLRQICEIQGGFEVVGEAADGEETVQLADVLKPDVILMDVYLPKLNSIQATSQILQAHQIDIYA